MFGLSSSQPQQEQDQSQDPAQTALDEAIEYHNRDGAPSFEAVAHSKDNGDVDYIVVFKGNDQTVFTFDEAVQIGKAALADKYNFVQK